MQVQIEFWQLIGAISSVLVAFAGVTWAFGKLLVTQFEKRLDTKFVTIEEDLKQVKKLEREFLEFKATLPERFVARPDYIRGQSTLEAKQDALYQKMEVVRLEIAQVKGATQ
ncbi:MAG: hypothetical protein AB1722_10730 [Pseudomonadota bacterium]